MWDNRCTLHQAVADHDHRESRVLQRTTITGAACGRVLPDEADPGKLAMAA